MGNFPILDYSKRESFAYMKEPTQGNLDALHAKQHEELRTRWLYASPLGALAVVFAIPRSSANETKEARVKPRTTTSKLHHENAIPASLLHNQERADGQDVRAGTIEAANGGARIGDQRLAKKIE
jgi:hypothetical protein